LDAGGKGKFFRIAIGLGDSRAFNSEKRNPNFKYYTRLCLEMRICKEYLGGKPHSYFIGLSREDKTKLLLFEEWERKREKSENDKLNLKINLDKQKNLDRQKGMK